MSRPFLRNKDILEVFPRDSRDLHVYNRRRWDVTLGAAGSLEALEFVQGLVEAALYRGFVAGELGEGVHCIGVTDETSAEAAVSVSSLAFISRNLERDSSRFCSSVDTGRFTSPKRSANL